MNFLSEPKKKVKWPDNVSKFTSRPEALAVCKTLSNMGYLHRCEKTGKGEVALLPRSRCEFEEDAYFAWIYEGNKTMSHLLTTVLVIGFLCCVCFPIWPQFLKVFVWSSSGFFMCSKVSFGCHVVVCPLCVLGFPLVPSGFPEVSSGFPWLFLLFS